MRTPSAADFEAVFDAAPDAMLIADGNGRIVCANRQTAALFGFGAPTMLVGQPLEVLLPEPYRAKHVGLRHTFATDTAHKQIPAREVPGRRQDGTEFSAEVSVTSTPTPSGTLLISVIRDVTERKRAEKVQADARDATEAKNRELDTFSASAAHDLRAPLRGMKGFAKLLLEHHGAKLDAEGQDWLGEIVLNAEKMSASIDALLALARVARTELRRQAIDLSALMRTTFEELALRDPERRVEVVVQPGVTVDLDPGLARCLVENLAENAWKFTRRTASPRIEFGSTQMGDVVHSFLRDNGAGFDSTFADKLFVPFHRLHTIAEFPGTGVGLATVKRVVVLHGGEIWANGHVDQGATFHFTLPLARTTPS